MADEPDNAFKNVAGRPNAGGTGENGMSKNGTGAESGPSGVPGQGYPVPDIGAGELIEIVYISTPESSLSDADVVAILETSAANNRERGITGLLLYDGANFVQVLEGAARDVWDTYAEILADPRHRDVRTVHEGRIPRRMFGRWGMAYRRIVTGEPILEVARRQLVEGRAVDPDLVNVGAWLRETLMPLDLYSWSRERV